MIHGVLHLCGFDDENEKDQREMQFAMAEMGDYLGLTHDATWTSALHPQVASASKKESA